MSELFPAVVKNVAAKNVELKKLVYVYLVRYAEEQQDLALLSISTFQKALKVLSNIDAVNFLGSQPVDPSQCSSGFIIYSSRNDFPDYASGNKGLCQGYEPIRSKSPYLLSICKK